MAGKPSKQTIHHQQHAAGAGPKSHKGSVGKATNAWKKPRKPRGFNKRGFYKR
jgi:hypothetical protein